MSTRVLRPNLQVLGTGATTPGPCVSNAELLDAISRLCGRGHRRRARFVLSRLGVEGRYLVRDLIAPIEAAREGQANADLAAEAVRIALGQAGVGPASLAYLLGHTASPDTRLPPGVAWVADKLSYAGPFAELRQACTGFANALQIAAGFLAMHDASPVAVVGSETGSLQFDFRPAFVDAEQLVNCVQMSDGAGAVVLGPAGGEAGLGVIEALWFGARGLDLEPGFWMSGIPSADKEVLGFRHDYEAVAERGPMLFEAGVEVARELGLPIEDFEHILPHQANGQMRRLVAEAFDIDPARVVEEGRVLGNMGSASIWVAFDRLLRSGRVLPGHAVLVLGAEATKYLHGGFIFRANEVGPQ